MQTPNDVTSARQCSCMGYFGLIFFFFFFYSWRKWRCVFHFYICQRSGQVRGDFLFDVSRHSYVSGTDNMMNRAKHVFRTVLQEGGTHLVTRFSKPRLHPWAGMGKMRPIRTRETLRWLIKTSLTYSISGRIT